MGVCPARPVHLHRVRHCSQSLAVTPGLQIFPGHSAYAAVGDLLRSMVHGKTRGPRGYREGFHFPGRKTRDPENLA